MIFTKHIDKITFEDITLFCDKQVKEGFNLDYKKDFPSDLAKTISAFANTFGGIVIIGIEEDGDGKPKLPVRGIPFEKGLDVKVINIILDNINPPIFPEIRVLDFVDGEDKRAIIIIRIPQSNETPHTINNKKSVYIRTDNRNKQEELATINEIEWLWSRRKKSEELKNLLYKNSEEKLENAYKSIKEVSDFSGQKTVLPTGLSKLRAQGIFSIMPLFPKNPLINVVELKNICTGNDLKVNDYFAGSLFPFINTPRISHQSVINYETLLYNNGIKFCEFNIYGLLLYQESLVDYSKKNSTEEEDTDNPVFFYRVLSRIEQFLDVSQRYYEKTGFWGLLEIKIRINDILGLRITKPENFLNSPLDNNVSLQKNLDLVRIVTKQELSDKRIDIVKDFFKEICLAFNFEISDKIIEDYLREKNKLN